MTFLDTRYRLDRDLSSRELARLAELSTVYGIRRLGVEGSALVVEYDASRIGEAQVLAEIRRAGIPVLPSKPLPQAV